MTHPSTRAEILTALESNAQMIVAFFSSIEDRVMFDGDPERWGPAHHLEHLRQTSCAVERALCSRLSPHSAARSRSYAEVRDAAASSLAATPRSRLLEMGRRVVIAPDARAADLIHAFAVASAGVRDAASTWTEETLDRFAMSHPIMGVLTVREMLLFMVVHERHHYRAVRSRVEAVEER